MLLEIQDSQDQKNIESKIQQGNNKEEETLLDGRRIVDLKFLGRQMWCVLCKEALSLEYIEKEFRRGLGSHLAIRCYKCLLINEMSTCTMQSSSDKRNIRFDINFKTVIGMIDFLSFYFRYYLPIILYIVRWSETDFYHSISREPISEYEISAI